MRKVTGILALLVALGGLWGCKKGNPPADTPAKPRPAAHKVDGAALLKAYEVVRVALAADDLKATQAGAAALAKTAGQEAGHAAGVEQKTLQEMAAAAGKVAAAKDFDAARLAFGEMSKHTISFVVADKARTSGVTAYQCPMAKGYKKWVQLDKDMANPYMGKKMLKCGGKDKLIP
ncbi:MAG: DUF3347 domain-containing protein [Myxococcales bacterium]|nr:DUF3347 domain-containing protein [Myxococcales bacterium]